MDLTDSASRSSRVHPTATVEDGASIGAGTRIWHHAHVRTGSSVGKDSSLGFCVFVDSGVTIGDRCKIQNHVSIYNGVTLESEILVGPSVTFTNDLYPRADNPEWSVTETKVRRGASLGANSTIVCGVEIGEWAMIGAGSVVIDDVAPNALVVGNPARQVGWVCSCGGRLGSVSQPDHKCVRCGSEWELG